MMKVYWPGKNKHVGCQYFFTQYGPVIMWQSTTFNKIATQAATAGFDVTIAYVNSLQETAFSMQATFKRLK